MVLVQTVYVSSKPSQAKALLPPNISSEYQLKRYVYCPYLDIEELNAIFTFFKLLEHVTYSSEFLDYNCT